MIGYGGDRVGSVPLQTVFRFYDIRENVWVTIWVTPRVSGAACMGVRVYVCMFVWCRGVCVDSVDVCVRETTR